MNIRIEGATGDVLSGLKCLHEIIHQLEPTTEQRRKISEAVNEVLSNLRDLIEDSGLQGVVHEISVHGSFARDTWLPGDTDVDIFVLFDKSLELEDLRKLTEELSQKLAVRLNTRLETRFASHPYYVIIYKGIELELIPAYKINDIREMKSAVDRTPFHTAYVLSKLSENPDLKRDIRVFKALLRKLGIYGAELEVRGFSGYLSEVLIITYGGLVPLLSAAAKWIPWKIYIPRKVPQKLRGTAPLVVLDPVDSQRNAAAAVSVEQLSKLIAFSNVFLKFPQILCCVLGEVESLEYLTYRPDKNTILLRLMGHPPLVKDALAGKVRRILDGVSNSLEREGFRVMRKLMVNLHGEWFIILQLEEAELPFLEKRVGPPVWHENSLNFLKKWVLNNPAPFIDGDRWVVISERKTRKAEDVIINALKAYKEYEWEILNGATSQERLPEAYYNDISRILAGNEVWILCLRRFLIGQTS